MFGNPEVTPGGRALKFYSTVRLEVRRAETIKNGTDMIGNRARIKVVKNKVAPPFKVAEVDIMYGQGISRTGELVDMAVEKDIINKSGSWYSYGSERIGQGRENAKNYLADHEDVEDEVRLKVRAAYGISDVPEEDLPTTEDEQINILPDDSTEE
jgi:recombination protein RecA